MHHHLFPTEDTFITNLVDYQDKNFGVNEFVRIGTTLGTVRTRELTKIYSYTNTSWSFNNHCFQNFTGTMTGSFVGSASFALGIIAGSASFTSSYFSGSLDGGSISVYSSSLSGSVVGTISGSILSGSIYGFEGQLTGSSGKISGVITGTDTRDEIWWRTGATKFSDRTLIKFDLNAISTSIANGEISSPEFKLNLKVCNEYQLPINYTIHAFPISQSWVMGNGSYIEGGSVNGVSWFYKDRSSGSAWVQPLTSSVRPVVDFLNTASNSTGSFNYGGGTWHTASHCTQSFNYESSDISMDVTPIVQQWLSGSIPNNGFILISSDEIVDSGSGYSLSFYGKDTNSISSPYLDVMWSDWTWNTGSVGTSSVVITSSSQLQVEYLARFRRVYFLQQRLP
jgi:hypothetical protein